MFNKLTDVPTEIVEFFQEVTKSEATGNTVAQAYNYQDENDIEQTGSKDVPEYVDVVYVEQIPFGECKPLAALERVIALGKSEKVIGMFASCVETNYLKDFLEGYLEYLSAVSEWTEARDSFEPVIDEETQEVSVFTLIEPVAPNRYTPTVEQIRQPYLSNTFKTARTKVMKKLTVEVDGIVFDADETSQNRMTRAIIMMGDSDVVPWTVADNSVVNCTSLMLKEALYKGGLAQSAVWTNPYT